MRILGIDYGLKRIGLAVSDETRTLAFPKETIQNSDRAVVEISLMCEKEGIENLVIGDSRDFGGRPNDLMEKIYPFKTALEARGFTVHLEEEYFSSVEAERFQGKGGDTDASAAAIILQRYLDKRRSML